MRRSGMATRKAVDLPFDLAGRAGMNLSLSTVLILGETFSRRTKLYLFLVNIVEIIFLRIVLDLKRSGK
jgi:hypothetical protein